MLTILRGYIIPILLFATFSTSKGYAQKRITFNAGVENSLPVGNFKQFYTFGIGPTAGIDYRIIKRANVYFSASYLTYFINSSNLDVTGSEIFLPMVFGAKLFIIPKFYVMGGAGLNLDFGNVVTPYQVYHIGIGSSLFNKISAELKYERTGTFDFTPKVIKLRIAYIF